MGNTIFFKVRCRSDTGRTDQEQDACSCEEGQHSSNQKRKASVAGLLQRDVRIGEERGTSLRLQADVGIVQSLGGSDGNPGTSGTKWYQNGTRSNLAGFKSDGKSSISY
jgi:hypothetical protein